MSIKRTKPKSDRREVGGGLAKGLGPSTTPRKKEPTWQEVMAEASEAAFVAYSAKGSFAEGTLIDHPTFGKGVVLGAEGRKMEVLFVDSRKMLVMGMT
jgi:hypothetical protein